MGRGGFPPSETGSFSAHHTAQWVGLLSSGVRCQVLGVRGQEEQNLRLLPFLRPDACDLTPSFLLDSCQNSTDTRSI